MRECSSLNYSCWENVKCERVWQGAHSSLDSDKISTGTLLIRNHSSRTLNAKWPQKRMNEHAERASGKPSNLCMTSLWIEMRSTLLPFHMNPLLFPYECSYAQRKVVTACAAWGRELWSKNRTSIICDEIISSTCASFSNQSLRYQMWDSLFM